jgi:hypothetical protein
MGVGRAHKGAMPHALDHDVRDELSFAYQQTMVFAAQDRLANSFRMHVQFRLCVLENSGGLCPGEAKLP